MNITAEQYRTAVEVLESLNPAPCTPAWFLRNDFSEAADRAEQLEETATALGNLANAGIGRHPLSIGVDLIRWLRDEGWTPPEGLF